jgi:hypothetical protein
LLRSPDDGGNASTAMYAMCGGVRALVLAQTTAVVELIRQAVARGERVLASAASNIAVDNMAERLLAHSAGHAKPLRVVRVGHPARLCVQPTTLKNAPQRRRTPHAARRTPYVAYSTPHAARATARGDMSSMARFAVALTHAGCRRCSRRRSTHVWRRRTARRSCAT